MHEPNDPLTPHQARTLAALFPDELDTLRDLVRNGRGWLTFHHEAAGLAVLLSAFDGRLCGWCAFPTTSRRSAEVAGRYLRAGLDLGAREVLDVAHDLAQAALIKSGRR